MNRSASRGALAAGLIVVGLAWLLVKWDVLTSGTAFGIMRLWPLFLIVPGLEMIFSARGSRLPGWVGPVLVFTLTAVVWLVPDLGPRGAATGDVRGNLSLASQNPSGDGVLTVVLDVGALELNLAGKEQENVTVDYTGVEPRLSEEGERVELQSRPQQWGGCARLDSSRARWDVGLPQKVPLDLAIEAGAAELNADLRQVILRSLDVDAGAADLHFVLPDTGKEMRMDLDTGAADITIEVPEGVAVKLISDSALSSTNVKDLSLVSSGDTLASPGFAEAASRVIIEVDSAVSDLTIRRR